MSDQSGNITAPSRVLLDERLLPERFLVVSNRLPYQVDLVDGEPRTKRGVGGLVTALDPILRKVGGTWIGWTGSYDDLPASVGLEDVAEGARYSLRPLSLSPEDVERYYLGYSNRCLWPLLHYFQEHCVFNRDEWEAYRRVNRRFADAVVDEYRPGDLVWIHDYHLLLVPGMVREKLPDARIGFFLHIPFPGPEIFSIDPHAEELLDGILGADLIGFHVETYARNFLDTVSRLTSHRYSKNSKTVDVDDRLVRAGAFPISIDFDAFDALARADEVPDSILRTRQYYNAEYIAIGVDRLDYTKGILERLQAIETMLERHPDMQGRLTFIQVSAPSRTKVDTYREMRERIEHMVGRINGRFGGRGCLPIDYRYESYPQQELVALYRAADAALVTPLRDGMNLVAKEYVASRVDESGSLVLSRFTGAYDELGPSSVTVNPYDAEETADQIRRAILMSDDEKARRMRAMRSVVRRNDIYWWLERFLRAML